MPEDLSTLGTRKIFIAIARSFIGSHYLHGTSGQVPDAGGELVMLPKLTESFKLASLPDITEWSTVFTARNGDKEGKKKRCTGRSGHPDVKSMPKGDHNNPEHLAIPEAYRWQRLVQIDNPNPLYGESCIGKAHFDCSGFVRFCLRQVLPNFYAFLRAEKSTTIAGMKRKLKAVNDSGVNISDLCAGDILIRKNNGHIGIATGGGSRVVQAEWEPSGVLETNLGEWQYHGRIEQNWWLDYAALEPEE